MKVSDQLSMSGIARMNELLHNMQCERDQVLERCTSLEILASSLKKKLAKEKEMLQFQKISSRLIYEYFENQCSVQTISSVVMNSFANVDRIYCCLNLNNFWYSVSIGSDENPRKLSSTFALNKHKNDSKLGIVTNEELDTILLEHFHIKSDAKLMNIRVNDYSIWNFVYSDATQEDSFSSRMSFLDVASSLLLRSFTNQYDSTNPRKISETITHKISYSMLESQRSQDRSKYFNLLNEVSLVLATAVPESSCEILLVNESNTFILSSYGGTLMYRNPQDDSIAIESLFRNSISVCNDPDNIRRHIRLDLNLNKQIHSILTVPLHTIFSFPKDSPKEPTTKQQSTGGATKQLLSLIHI